MTAATKPTIHEALAAVMAEVQEIGKGEKNKDLGFRFRGVDAVVNAVGPALRNQGVIVVPTSVEYDVEHYLTKKQTNMKNVTMRVGFRFYGPAGDFIDAAAAGEAADSGDKATPKAHSVAFRTLLLQALCIPTGEEDPDARSHDRGGAPIRQEGPPPANVPTSWPKVKAAFRQCDNPEESEALYEAFLRAATYHLYGQTSLKEVTADERKIVFQKAAGAAVWLAENVEHEGPFLFFGEDQHRQAWASVLDGHALEIPDYVPPEPPGTDEVDEEAAQLAREALADSDVAADYGA